MDVGATTIARMAREDTRWFIAGIVILSIVLFLALPMSVLVVVDHLKMKAELRAEHKAEKREINKLIEELKARKEKDE